MQLLVIIRWSYSQPKNLPTEPVYDTMNCKSIRFNLVISINMPYPWKRKFFKQSDEIIVVLRRSAKFLNLHQEFLKNILTVSRSTTKSSARSFWCIKWQPHYFEDPLRFCKIASVISVILLLRYLQNKFCFLKIWCGWCKGKVNE